MYIMNGVYIHKITSVGIILCCGWDLSSLRFRSDNPKAGKWIWELSYQRLKAENDSPRTVLLKPETEVVSFISIPTKPWRNPLCVT